MKEVKPALRFVLIFLSVYLLGNWGYGIWIESLGDRPDFVTSLVSRQVSGLLSLGGYDQVNYTHDASEPVVLLRSGEQVILRVYEGCNGINVIIVFVSFVFAFAFKDRTKSWIWFIPVGILIIHFFNLARVVWLYTLAFSASHYFHYFHKYVFTAIIYAVVFLLWWLWVIYGGHTRTAKT